MIEITNKTRGPVQLVVKSMSPNRKGKAISVVNIPGIGSGKNTYLLEDERHTDYIDRAEKLGLISQKRINRVKGE